MLGSVLFNKKNLSFQVSIQSNDLRLHDMYSTHVICCLHSKSARRKKREEAQKLPEVSKEIFYDVSGDLKAMFGQTKDDNAGGEEKTSWDFK